MTTRLIEKCLDIDLHEEQLHSEKYPYIIYDPARLSAEEVKELLLCKAPGTLIRIRKSAWKNINDSLTFCYS